MSTWKDQPESDTLFTGKVWCDEANDWVMFELNKLPDGQYQFVVGNLFGSKEVVRGVDGLGVMERALSTLAPSEATSIRLPPQGV